MRRRTLLALASAGPLLLAGWPRSTSAQATSTVTVAVAGDPGGLLGPPTPTLVLMQALVFDRLVGVDDRNQPYPRLAETIPTVENGLARLEGAGADRRLVVTMPLRAGVTWSDGTPFTAHDVAYTFRLMSNPLSGLSNSTAGRIRDAEVLDELTVRFVHLSAAERRLREQPEVLSAVDEPEIDPHFTTGLGPNAYILPAHRLREVLGSDPRNAQVADWETRSGLTLDPVGTGPFVLEVWEAGRGVSLRSRARSLPHRLGTPRLQRLIFVPYSTADAALAALAAGGVQVVASDLLGIEDAPRLELLADVPAAYVAGTTWEHLTFNLENSILSDVDVRRALAHGINRHEIAADAFAGKAAPMTSPIPDWSWVGGAAVPRYDFDPTLAGDLLQSRGWVRGLDGIRARSGRRLSLRLWTTPSPPRVQAAALVRAQLLRIGVEVETELVPERIFAHPRPVSPQSLTSRRFDLALLASEAQLDPGDGAWQQFHSRAIPGPENGYAGANYSGFRHARNDQLLEQGLMSADAPFRHAVYTQLQQLWMAELPVLPLVQHPVVSAASPGLVGFRPGLARGTETWNVEQWSL